MIGGNSTSKGIMLYNGEDAIFGYYINNNIEIVWGTKKEITKISKNLDNPKKDIQNKIFNRLLIFMIILLFLSIIIFNIRIIISILVFTIGGFFPILVLSYELFLPYISNEDNLQFKRYHALEHAIINLCNKEQDINMETLKSSSIYHNECGTVKALEFLILIILLSVLIYLDYSIIFSIKALLITIVILFINIFNPYNPLKYIQNFVVERPIDKDYELGFELLEELKNRYGE